MNASRKLTLLTIGIILVLPVVLNTGCFRVGQEDPFISFRTRKARVAGIWKIPEYTKYVRQDPGKGLNILLITTTSDSKKWQQDIQIEGTDSTVRHIGTVTYNENYYKFDKYGNYEKVYNYEYIDDKNLNDDGDLRRERHICREKIRGTWNFLGTIENDYKNRERMILNWEVREFREKVDTLVKFEDDESGLIPVWKPKSETLETQSYLNGEKSEVWKLIMLKNKEMHIEQEIRNNQTIVVNNQAEPNVNVTEIGYKRYTLKQ